MKGVQCVICKAAMPGDWSEYPDYPFCSKRCRMVDLGRWLGEDYRVGQQPDDAPSEDLSTPGDDEDH